MKKLKIILLAFIFILSTDHVLAASNLQIKLNGKDEIILVQGNKYQEQGVVVRGDNILKVETTGTVLENQVGNYIVAYTATDKEGDVVTKTRTVKVIEQPSILSDNYLPQISEPNTNLSSNGEVLGVNKYFFNQTLKFGSRNTEVTELHKKLIAEGYLKIPLPTGYFGNQTLTAVKGFQLAQGLLADGIVGPKTREALNK